MNGSQPNFGRRTEVRFGGGLVGKAAPRSAAEGGTSPTSKTKDGGAEAHGHGSATAGTAAAGEDGAAGSADHNQKALWQCSLSCYLSELQAGSQERHTWAFQAQSILDQERPKLLEAGLVVHFGGLHGLGKSFKMCEVPGILSTAWLCQELVKQLKEATSRLRLRRPAVQHAEQLHALVMRSEYSCEGF